MENEVSCIFILWKMTFYFTYTLFAALALTEIKISDINNTDFI
jgi:hypothetical protein